MPELMRTRQEIADEFSIDDRNTRVYNEGSFGLSFLSPFLVRVFHVSALPQGPRKGSGRSFMLRLYVWEDFPCGPEAAFALADSKEQAIELVVGTLNMVRPDKWREELSGREPLVIENPKGFVVWGNA